jgi:predicted GIY-YIG superfamily endonuclease
VTRPADRIRRLGETAVYRLYNADDRLLYVGVGSDPEKRWRDHAATKDWWPAVTRKSVQWHPAAAAALAEESTAIDTESPLHNIRRGCKTSLPAPRPGDVHAPVHLASESVGRLIDAAHYAGEITIITRHGEPWAAIVSLAVVEQAERTHDRHAS